MVSISFLLPHRVLASVGEMCGQLLLNKNRAPKIWSQFVKQCQKLGLDPGTAVPIGLHGDGVPFTKKHSLELISWNILGEGTGDRVPFTGVSKAFTCKCGCLGRCTWDSIMEVFSWSMRALLQGLHPTVGPKGEVLSGEMATLAGVPMPKGLLCQVRGDWPFLKQLFSVPAWNSFQICWMCLADFSEGPMDYREVDLRSAWRKNRMDTRQFLQFLHEQGIAPSPLFQSPGLLMEHVLLDWLHIVDLGVSQDIIGNFFHEVVLHGLPGNNKKERLQQLWLKIKAFYAENKSPSKLGELTLEMFEKSGKSPKLRCKGGECRHLVPFCASLGRELAHLGGHWQTVSQLLDLLLQCAQYAATVPFSSESLATASRKLCILWKKLRDAAAAEGSMAWTMKPKLHLFQELCEYKAEEFGSPELFWTYADESFCGFMAKAAKRRGGQNFAATVPERLLNRYRAMRSG